MKLSELSEQLRAHIASPGNPNDPYDFNEKRNLLERLRLEVLADPDSFHLSFTLGAQIISTSDAEREAKFNQALKEFEQQHPDISIEDLLDFNKQLPEDTPFARAVNKVKQNLVTIGQTWA